MNTRTLIPQARFQWCDRRGANGAREIVLQQAYTDARGGWEIFWEDVPRVVMPWVEPEPAKEVTP